VETVGTRRRPLDCGSLDALHEQRGGPARRRPKWTRHRALAHFIAGADLQQGQLRSILADYRAPELSLYAIYPPNRHLSVKVRVLIDFLVERFGRRPYWDLVD